MSSTENSPSVRPSDGGGKPCSRDKMKAILKVRAVAHYLVDNCRDRLRQLSDEGINQTDIARQLASAELHDYQFGTFDILRTAVSDAMRSILTPAEAEERRTDAWRASLAENVTTAGRLKGIAARNLIHGLPSGAALWLPEELVEFQSAVQTIIHPAGSRYAGKPDWQAIVAHMHGFPDFPKRALGAYKQRHGLLVNAPELSIAPTVTPPQTGDTAGLQPRV